MSDAEPNNNSNGGGANAEKMKKEDVRIEDQQFFKDIMEKTCSKFVKKYLITFTRVDNQNPAINITINLMIKKLADGSIEIDNLEQYSNYTDFCSFKKYSSTLIGINFWYHEVPLKLILCDKFCKQFIVNPILTLTVKVDAVLTLE